MYFPLFKLHGWNKRFADQPQTNYSEVPWFPIPGRVLWILIETGISASRLKIGCREGSDGDLRSGKDPQETASRLFMHPLWNEVCIACEYFGGFVNITLIKVYIINIFSEKTSFFGADML